MVKVKLIINRVLTEALKPELRPYEVRVLRYVWPIVAAYVGYKGYKAA